MPHGAITFCPIGPMNRSPTATVKSFFSDRPYRVVAAVLVAAFFVGQIMVLLAATSEHGREPLRQLRTEADTIVTVLNRLASAGVAPADFGALAEQVIPGTRLRGGTVYAAGGEVLRTFGETPELRVNGESAGDRNRVVASAAASAATSGRYDFAWRFSDSNGPYFIAVRMDSSGIGAVASNSTLRLMVGILIAALFASVAAMAVICSAVSGPLAIVQSALATGNTALMASMTVDTETELGAITRSARSHMETTIGRAL